MSYDLQEAVWRILHHKEKRIVVLEDLRSQLEALPEGNYYLYKHDDFLVYPSLLDGIVETDTHYWKATDKPRFSKEQWFKFIEHGLNQLRTFCIFDFVFKIKRD